MAQWDDILLQYLRDTPGVEPRMNIHRITADIRDGGMGLRQTWWTFITRRVTLGQNETRQTSRTNRQLTTTQYDTWTLYVHSEAPQDSASHGLGYKTKPADGLFYSESSEEDPELQAGRLKTATHRLSYDSLTRPYEPTLEETQQVLRTLPQPQSVPRVTRYYT